MQRDVLLRPVYTASVMPHPFITLRRALRWHHLLAVALVVVSLQDLRHDHADGIDARTCYSCHFSVELGALPSAALPATDPVPEAAPLLRQATRPLIPLLRGYDARGPPLLT